MPATGQRLQGESPYPDRMRLKSNAILAKAPALVGFHGLESVMLTLGEELHVSGKRIGHVYFPSGSLVSVIVAPRLKTDVAVEVGLIGSEGMVGVSIALGGRISRTSAVVQGTGLAMRATVKDFLGALQRNPALRERVGRYSDELAFLAAQTAACNRNHDAGQRLARWILLTRSYVGSDTLELTQQFLAHMLAVRRSGVSEAAAAFKRAGLIRYSRGIVHILDVAGLKALSCGCMGNSGALRRPS